MTAPIIDIFLVYQFMKRLVTPFEKTEAFKLGLIDAEGKRLRIAKTSKEKDSMGYFDRLIFNLKRLLALAPGGKTQIASYAAALLLLREEDERLVDESDHLEEQFKLVIDNIDMEQYNKIVQLLEDAPVNATGSGVVGTGDNQSHWSQRQPKLGQKGKLKKYGQAMDGVMFLRRAHYKKTREQQKSSHYRSLGDNVKVGR